jgi:hypothetical protein
MSSHSYVRTVIKVTVLSRGDFDWDSLTDVAYAISDGDCSGEAETESVEYLTPRQMNDALIAQGSDPDFLIPEEDIDPSWNEA